MKIIRVISSKGFEFKIKKKRVKNDFLIFKGE